MTSWRRFLKRLSRQSHRTHWKFLYLWIWLITGKGRKLQPAKARGIWGRVQMGAKYGASGHLPPWGGVTSSGHAVRQCAQQPANKEARLCLWCLSFYWSSTASCLCVWPFISSLSWNLQFIPLISSSAEVRTDMVWLHTHHKSCSLDNQDTSVRQDNARA